MAAYIRAAALGNYAEVARRLGLDPRRRLTAAGIDPASLADPDLPVPTAAVAALLEESARLSKCDTFALTMAEGWRMADLGVVSLLLAHERSVRAALATAERYRHLLNDSLSVSLEEAGTLAIVREEFAGGPATRSPQANELAMGVILRVFRALLGPDWRPVSVRFAHAAPPRGLAHRRFFGAPVLFDQELNAITCRREDLDRSNPNRDAGLARHAVRLLDATANPTRGDAAAIQDVMRSLHVRMPAGKASIEEVAHGLGITPRTLQRRLDAAGTSFSALLNRARRDLVPRYLANPAYSITQVGELLGYDFPSSFTRWFRKEFGRSPARWREYHGARR
ncbi:MAG TPA: AraC family transcriptional regulator [Usitatibacter sp.]|nr:AraC family transcriptional regulator [Usitatibacter sp.]